MRVMMMRTVREMGRRKSSTEVITWVSELTSWGGKGSKGNQSNLLKVNGVKGRGKLVRIQEKSEGERGIGHSISSGWITISTHQRLLAPTPRSWGSHQHPPLPGPTQFTDRPKILKEFYAGPLFPFSPFFPYVVIKEWCILSTSPSLLDSFVFGWRKYCPKDISNPHFHRPHSCTHSYPDILTIYSENPTPGFWQRILFLAQLSQKPFVVELSDHCCPVEQTNKRCARHFQSR